MKKAYTKPAIMFEDFTLSTNIAADCEHQNVLPSLGQTGCGIDFGNLVVFVENVLCSLSVGVDDGKYNTICYNIPAGGENIFTS